MRIQTNVLDAALANDVERVTFLGSSCIYPKFAEQPIREDPLLTGHLELTNDAYAIAKIAGILHTQAVRRQYGLPWISAMPTNLYGPNDNFSPRARTSSRCSSAGTTTPQKPAPPPSPTGAPEPPDASSSTPTTWRLPRSPQGPHPH